MTRGRRRGKGAVLQSERGRERGYVSRDDDDGSGGVYIEIDGGGENEGDEDGEKENKGAVFGVS